MARSPGFTLMALLVLAIGIGVNVAAFSVFDMVALRPLPVPDADRLVRLERRSPNDYTSEMAYPSFLFYRDHAKTLAAAIAVLGVPPMHIDDDIQGVSTAFVAPNLLHAVRHSGGAWAHAQSGGRRHNWRSARDGDRLRSCRPNVASA